MLLTQYLVGRKKVGDREDVLVLVVDSVLPTDLKAGRAEIVPKMTRQDLVLEFVSDSEPVEWLNFPDLPRDVVDALKRGERIPVVDSSDDSIVMVEISTGPDSMAI